MTVLLLVCPASRGAPSQPQLLTHGTDDAYWIARVEPVPETSGQRTVLQLRAKFDDRWKLVGSIDSRAISLADRGTDLAVLLDTGQWMLLWPGGGTVGRSLPAGMRILALGGDGGNTLWAVGRGEFRESGSPTTAPATVPTTEGATSIDLPTSRPTTSSADPLSETLAIYQLAGNEWQPRATLPADFDTSRYGEVSLAVIASVPTMALRDAAGNVRVLRLRDAANGKPPVFENVSLGKAGAFKLLVQPTRSALWLDSAGPVGSILFLDDLHAQPVALSAPQDLTGADERSVTAASGAIRLVYAHDGKLYEQSYAPDGQVKGTPRLLPVSQPAPTRGVYEWFMLPGLLLLTFLVFGPTRRRPEEMPVIGGDESPSADVIESGTEDRSTRARQRLVIAPPPLRFIAGMIDAFPLVIVAFLAGMQMQGTAPEDVSEIVSRWGGTPLLAVGVHFLHTFIAEMIWGRSLGKWVMGLRVVAMNGQRPGPGAVLARNVIRVIELGLVGVPMMLVFFTPLHQRAGDLAAGTAVVIERPAGASDDDDDE